MSSVSQTPPAARFGFALPFAIAMLVVAGVIALAMGPVGGAMVKAASQARLHGPDLAVWNRLGLPIQIHLATALAALILGWFLMFARKGRTFHRFAGWAWVLLVAATAIATFFIRTINPGGWSLLHLITAWTVIVLPLAVLAVKRRDIAKHRKHMMGLFYGGFAINVFIAFLPGRALWMMFFG